MHMSNVQGQVVRAMESTYSSQTEITRSRTTSFVTIATASFGRAEVEERLFCITM